MPRIGQWPPRLTARIAGALYLVTFVMGITALMIRGWPASVAGLTAGASYVAVTLLFYRIFRPVSRSLSLLAAVVGLAGCAYGPLRLLHLVSFRINGLVFFGVYCVMIGYLIIRSSYLPRALGVLLAISGMGWLTFLFPSANAWTPYLYAPGIIGEGALMFWLLVRGVDEPHWKEQDAAAR